MNRRLKSLTLTGSLLVAACRVGPNYQMPAKPNGAEAPLTSYDFAAETLAVAPDDWWVLYSDARLNDFILEALRANRDLKAANANFAAARAIVGSAKAARYPSTRVEAGGIYGRDATTDEILELGGRQPENIWLIEDIFEVGYEVDLFGRVRRSVEAAASNAESMAAARDAVKVVTAASTARAYAQVCALGEELAVARHSLDVVSNESEITVRRHEAGANSSFDVVRAQALVAQVRSTIPSLKGQRRAALLELTALLGRTPANAPNEVDACMSPPHLTALIPIGDGALLLKRRPDVRQAERRLASATAQIGVATADLYPTIRLGGLIGSVGTELSDLTANRGLTWGVGPSVSWTFPNQAGPRARVRQAKANQAALLAAFDSVVLGALKETEQALALYSAALDNRQSLGDAQEKVHTAFEMAHEQFLAGSGSSLDLLTTEQTLVAIDAQVAASDAALVQDQIAVFKALGGGWQASPLTSEPSTTLAKQPR
jgi:NodT family efflux transporter outer membrane factor (OMF) lipoprotein